MSAKSNTPTLFMSSSKSLLGVDKLHAEGIKGKYKLEFIATDKEGNTTSKSQPFTVYNTPAKTTEVSYEGGLHIYTLRQTKKKQ